MRLRLISITNTKGEMWVMLKMWRRCQNWLNQFYVQLRCEKWKISCVVWEVSDWKMMIWMWMESSNECIFTLSEVSKWVMGGRGLAGLCRGERWKKIVDANMTNWYVLWRSISCCGKLICFPGTVWGLMRCEMLRYSFSIRLVVNWNKC